MELLKNLSSQFRTAFSDDSFLAGLKRVERFSAKILSIAMVVVLLVSLYDLSVYLIRDLFAPPAGFFATTLIEIFGLFLNILIALEILENIAAYLKTQAVQLELVIITSLTAVARKIIIFDFKTTPGIYLAGLGLGIFALSVSYWIVRNANRDHNGHH